MGDLYREIGVRVRHERLRLGWTQEELAEKSDLHPAYVGQIERGEKKISIETLRRLAKAVSVRMSDLLNESALPPPADWESRIGGLLRDRDPQEARFLYDTLRQLARGLQARSKSRRS
ncbi:MAG: helix-turn-helix transcriptional regulator [Elusimicrobia bacterium]|nr:helix-turn-helix transcriptional regulator [Elusimicrobiota bacterium]